MKAGCRNIQELNGQCLTEASFHSPAIYLPHCDVQVQHVGFPARDEISSRVGKAAGLQRQHADWTTHRTATKLDWTFCLPSHQPGTAGPTVIVAINKPSSVNTPSNTFHV